MNEKFNINIIGTSGMISYGKPKKKARKKFKNEPCQFDELTGQTIISVRVGLDKVVFVTDEYYEYTLKNEGYYTTELKSIKGDVNSLIGKCINTAKEKIYRDTLPKCFDDCGADSFTYSIYKIKTLSGKVKFTFLNWSNEEFSESINVTKTTLKKNTKNV